MNPSLIIVAIQKSELSSNSSKMMTLSAKNKKKSPRAKSKEEAENQSSGQESQPCSSTGEILELQGLEV